MSTSDRSSPHAFPKERRLRKRTEFLRVQREGRSVRTRDFVLLISRTGADLPVRIGLVASRKVGHAVARNRGKRLIREWFRRLVASPRGVDIVIILRRGACERSLDEISRQLDSALPRLLRLVARPRASR